MTEAWKRWEGQVVNGEFHLRQYLGGDENSAVFLTEYGEQGLPAAIKLVPAHLENAEFQLSQWELAAKLSHPHLIRLFQMGRCQLGDMALLYVVMEDAEEDLSQILPQRALTAAKARDAGARFGRPGIPSRPRVRTRSHQTRKHVAVEDQVKISSDGLCRVDEWGRRWEAGRIRRTRDRGERDLAAR